MARTQYQYLICLSDSRLAISKNDAEHDTFESVPFNMLPAGIAPDEVQFISILSKDHSTEIMLAESKLFKKLYATEIGLSSSLHLFALPRPISGFLSTASLIYTRLNKVP